MAHLNLLLRLILPTANAVLGQMSPTAAAADTRPHGEVIWKQWKAKYSWAMINICHIHDIPMVLGTP